MGGVDSSTGRVIDTHHPLHGQSVAGKVLALPSGRGSCSGSATLFELLLNGHAPAALIFRADEPILTLGVILAAEVFGVGIPVVRLSAADFAQLRSASRVSVRDGTVTVTEEITSPAAPTSAAGARSVRLRTHRPRPPAAVRGLRRGRPTGHPGGHPGGAAGGRARSDRHRARPHRRLLLPGTGESALRRAAGRAGRSGRGADEHELPCASTAAAGASQGVPAELGEPSEAVADAYLRLGVTPTYTCAPYLLDGPPACGQQIAWAESNAVVFANAVIGARTMKYPDYLDILIALIGRAPNAGAHTDAGRRADRGDRGRPAARAARRRVLSDAGLPRRHDRQQRHPGADRTGAHRPDDG